ncbi:MAG: hypothetical protein NTV61_01160 [Candidatus Bathyarchaeota archaeon]|nr:hypothetical protein [Candidatus Bathyarchaeota archaeon]
MAEKDKEKLVSREEIIGLVQLVIIFTAILAGREVGNLYSSYNELSRLSVNLSFTEEEMSTYLRDTIQGRNSTLNVGMAVTIPGFTSTEGQVTQTPDYVRKWLISVTLSPIVVNQPEVSDVDLIMLVEGQQVLSKTYTFPKQKVGFISFLNRNIPLTVEDKAAFRRLVSEAAAAHAGEVEITITGHAKANVLFFESTLPFKTTKYPLVLPPSLTLDGSRWETIDGSGKTTRVGELASVSISLSNPTRVHSLTQNVTCRIYMEGEAEPVATITKRTTAAAGTVSTYFFSFTPSQPGVYFYTLESGGVPLSTEASPRLTVSP